MMEGLLKLYLVKFFKKRFIRILQLRFMLPERIHPSPVSINGQTLFAHKILKNNFKKYSRLSSLHSCQTNLGN